MLQCSVSLLLLLMEMDSLPPALHCPVPPQHCAKHLAALYSISSWIHI